MSAVANATRCVVQHSKRMLSVTGQAQWKKGIHPPLFEVKVVGSNGSTMTINQTMARPGYFFMKDDVYNTAPWDPTGNAMRDTDGRVAMFERKLEEQEHSFVLPEGFMDNDDGK
eukprot:m.351414 g.351414  ORF g.351414 m.351414 type:complete len:114 (+) comp16241_c0_seq1:8487-8828(+)